MIGPISHHVLSATLILTPVLIAILLTRFIIRRDVVFRYSVERTFVLIGIFILPVQIFVNEWQPQLGNPSDSLSPSREYVKSPIANFDRKLSDPDGHQKLTMLLGNHNEASSVSIESSWFMVLSQIRETTKHIGIVYFSGVIFYVSILLFKIVRTIRILQRCEPLKDSELELSQLRRYESFQPNFLSSIRWLESAELDTAASLWLGRPIVILPIGIIHQLTEEQLGIVAAHEATHLCRRDWIWASIECLLRSIFWFHPLVWIATYRISRDRELSCDAIIVRQIAQPRSYADTILAMYARSVTDTPKAATATLTFNSLKSIKRRLEMLTYARQKVSFSFRSMLSFVTILFAIAICFSTWASASVLDLPKILSANTPVPSVVRHDGHDGQEKLAPPIAGIFNAAKKGRDTMDVYKSYIQINKKYNRSVPSEGFMRSNESILIAEKPNVSGNIIRAKELRIYVPEGSNMVAKYFGTSMIAKQVKGKSQIVLDDGGINLIDQGGIVRIAGMVSLDAKKGAKLFLTATFDRGEILILVTAQDSGGNAIDVRAEIDTEKGRPKDETQPPHLAIRYQLIREQDGKPLVLQMQWHYDLKKLRQEAEGK